MGILSSIRDLFSGERTAPLPAGSPTKPHGSGGTAMASGYVITNERNPAMVGQARWRTYGDMVTGVSIVAAAVRFYLNLVSKAEWKVLPATGPKVEGREEEAQELADWIDEVIHDMDTPWHRVVRRTAYYRFPGFSIQEWTAKKREQDGLYGLLDVEARPQKTIERWVVDPSGTVLGVIQRSPQTQQEMLLPRSRLVYVVDDSIDDSPEGMGLLRQVADQSRILQRYEQLEAFGFETDLRGTPILRAPISRLKEMLDEERLTQAEFDAILAPLKEFVQQHVRSPQLGMLLDSLPYIAQDDVATPSNIKQFDIELLKAETKGQEAMHQAIVRKNMEIARVLGVENLMLGGMTTGSYALSKDKSENFALNVQGALTELRFAYKRDLVRPLFELNGKDLLLMPELVPDTVQYRDIQEVTQSLVHMAQAGAVLAPDDPAINDIRDLLGISRADLEAAARMAEEMRQAEMDAMAMPAPGPGGEPGKPGEAGPPSKGGKDNESKGGAKPGSTSGKTGTTPSTSRKK